MLDEGHGGGGMSGGVKPASGPALLQAQVAQARKEPAAKVTNQQVINFVMANGKRTYEQGAAKALTYGVELNSLVADRKAAFDTGAVWKPPAQTPGKTPVTTPPKDPGAAALAESVSELTRDLPPSLNKKIQTNIVDIHTKAQALYEKGIASGQTEAEATAARQAFVEQEVRARLPKLDADIAALKLPADQQALWESVKSEVGKPGLYAKALVADQAFEESSNLSVEDSDAVYGKPPPKAPGPYPATLPASGSLTKVELNYEASLRKDPLFAQRILGAAGAYRGPMNGRWNPQLEQAVRYHVAEYRLLRAKVGSLDPKSESVIITLLPEAQVAARKTVQAINADSKRTGITAKVLWGTRTYEQQNQLYAKRPKVTNARGGFSNHNFGIAFDLGLFKNGKYLQSAAPYNQAHQKVDMTGLLWGGDWRRMKDAPHYQLPIRGQAPNVGQLRGLFERGRALPVT